MKNTPTNSKKYNLDFALKLHNKNMKLNDMDIVDNKTYLDNYTNQYHVNNFTFRDKKDWQPNKPSEIVTLGCSHTYGIGVPQEYTWPSIIETKTGKTVANLGICGASAQKTMESFFLYLDTVGIPEYVLACFPDHHRYSHISEGSFFYLNDNEGNNSKSRKVITHTRTSDHINGSVNIENKIIKLPTDPTYMISTEESISQYISSIYTIEAICNLLNIKFYWGTWHDSTRMMFLENLFTMDDFCLNRNTFVETIRSQVLANPLLKNVDYLDEENCDSTHDMKSEDFDKYKSMWKIASDKSHLGIHWQQHTADSFIAKIEKDK
jgi:hypothetical protein